MLREVPSQLAIVHRLVELSHLLDKATEDADKLDESAVVTRSRHRVAYAKAFINATGAIDMRHQQAIAQCEDARFEYEIADQKLRACKERIRTLRDQIDLARSLSAAIRSEWAAGGIGP